MHEPLPGLAEATTTARRFFGAPSSLPYLGHFICCPPDEHSVSMTRYWVIHSCCVMCFCEDTLGFENILAS